DNSANRQDRRSNPPDLAGSRNPGCKLVCSRCDNKTRRATDSCTSAPIAASPGLRLSQEEAVAVVEDDSVDSDWVNSSTAIAHHSRRALLHKFSTCLISGNDGKAERTRSHKPLQDPGKEGSQNGHRDHGDPVCDSCADQFGCYVGDDNTSERRKGCAGRPR